MKEVSWSGLLAHRVEVLAQRRRALELMLFPVLVFEFG
jgi:hypothetical protein